ncbi:unnamed protein product [Cylindrotheca closterium]|uniref:RNA polymerase sigma-70 region 2 domain-containing protein n=1 Tax=Cylindrotheca closterium TaxID=2856 RepID=A0AAD2FQM7_9STRA|nr:unnamed protein product [Cylindrotheca closterium]
MVSNYRSNSKRAALLNAVCLSLLASPAIGFTTFSSSPSTTALQLHTTMKRVRTTSQTTIFARSSVNGMAQAELSSPSETNRLSLEEEKELLRQAVEMRRITKIESDMTMRSAGLNKPLLLERSRAAGYGEDLDAYESAILDGQQARDLLVTRNIGLVHYSIKQIVGQRRHLNSLSREDLVQEGSIGLARAVDRWNPEIGGRFSTYAVYWIRASVLRCIAERDDMLRVPVHVTQSVKNIEKAARRIGIDLTNDSWREANSAKQLAEEAGLSVKNFEDAMNVRMRRLGGGYTSFECYMQKGKQMASDVFTLREEEEQEMSNIQVDQLKSTLSKYLRPKEMEAISWRYGLVKSTSNESPKQKANRYLAEMEEELFCQTPAAREKMVTKGKWGEAMSFSEVGKHMKVSAEYGRRLCHAALKKLQQAAEEGKLEPALLM